METCSELTATNTCLLEQARSLVRRIDDATFSTSPEGLYPHRIGSHLRHVLEFYDCFLDGLKTLRIDYDARKRDETLERNRRAAVAKVSSIVRRLGEASTLPEGLALDVRMEGNEANVWLRSSFGRELQALSSHTIHHFALIALTLRLHGTEVDANFGMSPSTLRFQAARPRLALTEAA
ncbi:MAG TPA: hypothetical protein VKB79_01895 [Bryobacteraceae bacterium]|nr:hypothetical protein [Bryobacteraceae bacterium]